ncbi:acrosin-like isoform X2 [Cyanistes caeruleus]|nr:acrosin-like isoform X1 [Cyanistes caeruleus]XP_023801268.1 acrosin-like isoform X2 [Cyanistes caeruleus]
MISKAPFYQKPFYSSSNSCCPSPNAPDPPPALRTWNPPLCDISPGTEGTKDTVAAVGIAAVAVMLHGALSACCSHEPLAAMNWLSLLVLMTVAGLAHSMEYTCGGSCGFRAPVYNHNTAFDYGLTRIVGGTDALDASWPWIVSLQHPWAPYLGHFCGGSLITADWVLTAAHCFKVYNNISMVYVLIGATQLSQPGPGAVVRNVKKVVIHPYYISAANYSYDIAILQLDQPVLCSQYIQLACVADPALRVSELYNCWIAGWGYTTEKSQQSADRLQEAKVQLIDVQLCNSTGWHTGIVQPHNLCAGYPEGNIDTCRGDSGGPLMCQDNNAEYWWVVGISSWGRGCGRPKWPGVFVSTQYFYDWIVYNMHAHAIESAS